MNNNHYVFVFVRQYFIVSIFLLGEIICPQQSKCFHRRMRRSARQFPPLDLLPKRIARGRWSCNFIRTKSIIEEEEGETFFRQYRFNKIEQDCHPRNTSDGSRQGSNKLIESLLEYDFKCTCRYSMCNPP